MDYTLQKLIKLSREGRKKPMRRVVQETGTSCGMACVAMLAGINHEQALWLDNEFLEKAENETSDRSLASDLRYLLKMVKLRLGRRVDCTDWKKVPPGSLAGVQLKKNKAGKETWHWVVSGEDEEGAFFFDPNTTVQRERRRDFEKVPLFCYHRCSKVAEKGS